MATRLRPTRSRRKPRSHRRPPPAQRRSVADHVVVDDAPIVRFVSQREEHLGDCTVAAFAMCVGVTYSEALVAIAAVTPTVLEAGANWRQIRRAAKRLGVTFVEKTTIDLEDLEEDDSGMLAVAFPGGLQHAVYVKRGLIFDGRSGAIWDADVYVRVNKVEVLTMLVRTR